MKGVTESGFEYDIEEEKLSDWRVVKKLAKLTELASEDEGDALRFINIMSDIEELIFKDKGRAFENYILRQNNGTVAPAVALKDLISIFKNARSKNS